MLMNGESFASFFCPPSRDCQCRSRPSLFIFLVASPREYIPSSLLCANPPISFFAREKWANYREVGGKKENPIYYLSAQQRMGQEPHCDTGALGFRSSAVRNSLGSPPTQPNPPRGSLKGNFPPHSDKGVGPPPYTGKKNQRDRDYINTRRRRLPKQAGSYHATIGGRRVRIESRDLQNSL